MRQPAPQNDLFGDISHVSEAAQPAPVQVKADQLFNMSGFDTNAAANVSSNPEPA